jgi:hypothetical protein
MNADEKGKQQGGGSRGDKQNAPSGQQQQLQGGEGKQYGEGNYKATRDYNRGLKEHVEHHDIEKEARDAAPRSEAEAREMEQAERIAKSKSRGEGGNGSPDDAENPGDRGK